MSKWLILIYLTYACLPLFSKSIFYSIISFLLFLIGLRFHKFTQNAVTIFLFRLLLMNVSALIISGNFEELLKQESNHSISIFEPYMVFGLSFFMIISFTVSMIEFLIRLVIDLPDFNKISNKYDKLVSYGKVFLTFISPFFLPNVFFGFNYYFIFSVFYNFDLSFFQSYYLSFVISYTMPLANKEVLDLIEIINSNMVFNIIQIFHITIHKIIDLTIIAIVIKYVSTFLTYRFDRPL